MAIDNPPDLIPRKVLFGNPWRTMVTLSRDGTRLAFLAPVNGVMNVWVAPLDALDEAMPVTADTGRGIRFYIWTFHPNRILYIQDAGGDENWRLYSVDLDSLEARDLTPCEGAQARLEALSPRFPNEALVALNNREPHLHDIHRIDILTGESSLAQLNDMDAAEFVADQAFAVRLAMVAQPDGGMTIMRRSPCDDWTPMMAQWARHIRAGGDRHGRHV